MKRYILILSLVSFVLCLSVAAVSSQEVIELKPPTTDTVDGTIQQLDKVKKFMIIKPNRLEMEKELKISWNDKTQVVQLQERTATIDELKVSQEVRIKYTSEKRVLIIRNIPTEVVVDRIASEIRIISRGEGVKDTRIKELILKDIKIDNIFTSTDVTISQPQSGGALEVKGQLEQVLIGQSTRPNLIGSGARHRFKGRVEMYGAGFENYVFEGDENDPLTFVCVYGKGYVYMGGKGKVIMKKDGREVKLGYSD